MSLNKIIHYNTMIKEAFLSTNAIDILMGLASSKETITSQVDLTVQICFCQYNTAFNIWFYCICDLTHNYSNFLIKKTKKPINRYDIIRIIEVISYHDTQRNCLVFVITAYQVIANGNFGLLEHTQYYLKLKSPLKTIAPIALTDCSYIMVNDLPKTATHILMLLRVIRQSSILYNISNINNNKKFFYFEAEDRNYNRLRLFAFNEKSAIFYKPDSIYFSIKVGSYYQIEGEFAELRGNLSYLDNIPEVFLSSQSQVRQVPIEKLVQFPNMSNTDEIPMNNLVRIKEIFSLQNYLLIDLLAKVIEIDNIECKFVSDKKEGQKRIEWQKRMVVLDSSGYQIEVLLVNYFSLYHIKLDDILLLEAFKINSRKHNKRKVLTPVFHSKIIINPKNEKAIALNTFLTTNKERITIKARLSMLDKYSCIYISELKGTSYGFNTLKGRVKIKASIVGVDLSLKNIYEGCDICRASLVVKYMEWYCPQCNKRIMSPNYYYRLNVLIQDCSSAINVQLSDHCANKLLVIDAYQYKQYVSQTSQTKSILLNLSSSFKYEKMYFFIEDASLRPIEIYHIDGINIPLETRALAHHLSSSFAKLFIL